MFTHVCKRSAWVRVEFKGTRHSLVINVGRDERSYRAGERWSAFYLSRSTHNDSQPERWLHCFGGMWFEKRMKGNDKKHKSDSWLRKEVLSLAVSPHTHTRQHQHTQRWEQTSWRRDNFLLHHREGKGRERYSIVAFAKIITLFQIIFRQRRLRKQIAAWDAYFPPSPSSIPEEKKNRHTLVCRLVTGGLLGNIFETTQTVYAPTFLSPLNLMKSSACLPVSAEIVIISWQQPRRSKESKIIKKLKTRSWRIHRLHASLCKHYDTRYFCCLSLSRWVMVWWKSAST